MSGFTGYFTQVDEVLENKLGIQNPDEMKRIETEVVSIRMAELIAEPPEGDMDYEFLCMVHRRLFGDLYWMAGKTREVDIAKGSSAFCYVQFIEDERRRIFRQMRNRLRSDNTDLGEAAKQLAWLASELNALHPFREGNGRAIRTFMVLLAKRMGYQLNYSAVSEERRLAADIHAFVGDFADIEQVYTEMLK